jgi:hypothetical protein
MMDKEIETIAAGLGVELTPEVRKLVWHVQHRALIQFWKNATRQTEYQTEVLEKAMKAEGLL